jgi:molecular chaperone DnaK
MRTTIDFGIDLGTTNSAIAVITGTRAQVIKNNDSMEYTPSVVYIDKNNRLSVGRVAKQRLEQESEDTFSEFKLQMGTKREYRFKNSGKVMLPEDLSAEVLKALKRDVSQRLGEDIRAAVITVPAAFDLPQCDATRRAANLAGLETAPLIMEPTAAAMAHAFQTRSDKVFWLVYDLGGGTFDAAVIQIREGTFRIVNHAGDNQLGGKLIDWEIVDKLLAPAAAKVHKLTNFTRGNDKWRTAFAKLKYAAEEAKIQLSTNPSHQITIDYLCKNDSGEPVPFEYELTRKEVFSLAQPFIQRSVNISRQALAEAKLGTSNIEKVILVGGPTLAPYLREMLQDPHEGLGIQLDYSIDPLTVVAQGAAIFAGNQSLNGGGGDILPPVGTYRVDLQYDPMGGDPEPPIGGRVVTKEQENLDGYAIEFINSTSQPAWRSGKVPLDAEGRFMTVLFATRGTQNIFQIELTDRVGRVIPTEPVHFPYTLGVVSTAQPLIHSMGVALVSNEVKWYMEKGTTLPNRQRHELHTYHALHRGSASESLKVPVIEGGNTRADRNRVIGILKIKAEEIRRDVPAGTEVEVTLEIDESRMVKVSAYIPLLDQEFNDSLALEKPMVDTDFLRKDLEKERKRLDAARSRAQDLGDKNALDILEQKVDGENMLDNVDTALAASKNDPDAADKAQNRLLDLKIAVDQVEDLLEMPVLLKDAEDKIKRGREIVSQYGDADNKKRLEQLERELRQAMQNREADQIRRKMDEIDTLVIIVLRERPEFWVGFFQHLEERKQYMTDQAQAQQLFTQGNRAIQGNDIARLKACVQQLLPLLPKEQQDEINDFTGVGH